MISDEKKQVLMDKGFTADEIARLEESNQVDASEAKEQGLETKEVEPETEPVSEPEVKDTEAVPEPKPEETKSQDEQPEVLTADVILKAVVVAIAPMREQLDGMENRLKELEKTDEEKIDAELKQTPKISFEAQLASAIGNRETRVDGRTKEAKLGPKETEAPDQKPTPFAIINDQIALANQQRAQVN